MLMLMLMLMMFTVSITAVRYCVLTESACEGVGCTSQVSGCVNESEAESGPVKHSRKCDALGSVMRTIKTWQLRPASAHWLHHAHGMSSPLSSSCLMSIPLVFFLVTSVSITMSMHMVVIMIIFTTTTILFIIIIITIVIIIPLLYRFISQSSCTKHNHLQRCRSGVPCLHGHRH